MGFFYRHNIHPYTECLKRQDTLQLYADQIDLRMIFQEDYDLEGFIQNVVYREDNRCYYCYHDRLRTTALLAKRGKFDYFSSTLLYSKYQKHDAINSMGDAIGKSVGVPFLYQDFRTGSFDNRNVRFPPKPTLAVLISQIRIWIHTSAKLPPERL